jgi:hypothetical protein
MLLLVYGAHSSETYNNSIKALGRPLVVLKLCFYQLVG